MNNAENERKFTFIREMSEFSEQKKNFLFERSSEDL